MDKAKETNRKAAGKIGEEIAAKFLVSKGFKILERNYRKPWGEIDIVASKNEVLHFVEVKTVSCENSGAAVSRESGSYRPEEQAHPWKLRKVARTAELYMEGKRLKNDYQIDVLGILLDTTTRRARCRFFEQVL